MVEVEDDGVGMAEGRAREVGFVSRGAGIGMRNVRERLEVLYGTAPASRCSAAPEGERVSRWRFRWRRMCWCLPIDLGARQHPLVVLLVDGDMREAQ